jgi:hypothetical protein
MLLNLPAPEIAAEIVHAAAVVVPVVVEVAADAVVVAVTVVAEDVVATVVADAADLVVAAEVATRTSSRKLQRPRQKSRPFSLRIIQSSDCPRIKETTCARSDPEAFRSS